MPEAIKKMLLKFEGTCKEFNEAERSLVAYVSTKDVDRYGDIVMPEAFELEKYRKNPVVLWAHDYETPPIAKAMWIKADERGLLAKVVFAKTQLGDEVFGLYKDGFMQAFSVGFIPKAWHDERRVAEGDSGEGQNIRVYDKVELIEFSAVPVPANAEALALAISKGAIKSDRIKKELNIEEEVEDNEIEVNETEYEFSATARSIEFANQDHMFLTPIIKHDGVSVLVAPMCKEWKEGSETSPNVRAYRFVFSKDFNWTKEKIQKWVKENLEIVDDLSPLLWEKEFFLNATQELKAEKLALTSELEALKKSLEKPKNKTVADITPEELHSRIERNIGRVISKLKGQQQ